MRFAFHFCPKTTQASSWSGELQRLAGAAADPRTVLEADAYHAFMCGSVSLDREHWAEALQHFVHAQLRDPP